jgi:hypothetical protein
VNDHDIIVTALAGESAVGENAVNVINLALEIATTEAYDIMSTTSDGDNARYVLAHAHASRLKALSEFICSHVAVAFKADGGES